MSGRAYRRLLKEKEELAAAAAAAAKLDAQADDSASDRDDKSEPQGSDDEDDVPPAVAKRPFNPFALLMDDGDDENQSQSEPESDQDQVAQSKSEAEPVPEPEPDSDADAEEVAPEPVQAHSNKGKGGKKNKKKKNKKSKAANANANANQRSVDDLTLQELDAVLSEVTAADASSAASTAAAVSSLPGSSSSHSSNNNQYLAIDAKHLDPDTELARLFGSSVLRDAQRNNPINDQDAALLAGAQPAAGGNRRARARAARNQQAGAQPTLALRKSTLAGTPDASWPPYHLMGLHTRKLRVPRSLLSLSSATDNQLVDITAVTHTPTYARLHSAYLTSALSGDPNALLALRHQSAYHPDTLLRLAHVSTMYSQPDQAKSLLRQCLYALDRALHVAWAPVPPRMPYAVPNNRIVHLALLAQVTATARMAGGRTAVEVAKLLLALDPEADPLGMREVLPALAVRARESRWVVDWMDAEEAVVEERPHWAFSRALALWQMEQVDEANAELVRAVHRWPGVARVIVPSVTVIADAHAPSAAPGAFAGDSDDVSPAVALYMHYATHVWTDPAVVAWVAETLPPVVHVKSAASPPTLDASTDMPVFRHIVAADIQALAGRIPAAYRTGAYMNAIDPMPPTVPETDFEGKEVFEDAYADVMRMAQGGGVEGALGGLEQQLMQAVQGGMGVEAVRELVARLPAGVARMFGLGGGGGEEGEVEVDEEDGSEVEGVEGEESEWEDYAHLLNPPGEGSEEQEQAGEE